MTAPDAVVTVRFACVKCRRPAAWQGPPGAAAGACEGCGTAWRAEIPPGPAARCPFCRNDEFYREKRVPRRLGLIVVGGGALAALALMAWNHFAGMGLLLGLAAVDLLLFRLLPERAVCYRCGGEVWGLPMNPAHSPYDLGIAEGYRQAALAAHDKPTEPAVPEFVKVAAVTDLPPGRGKIVKVGPKELALFNAGGRFCAVKNMCPHRGGNLGQGILEGQVVQCPLHGWKFDVTTGDCTDHPGVRIPTYTVQVEGSDVSITLG